MIKTRGTTAAVTESITLDRLGFVSACIKRTYADGEIGALPPAPQQTVMGAIWTRTVVEAADGISTVRWLYEGLATGKPTVYLHDWQGSFETVPIQAHPLYRTWLGPYGTEDSQGNWRPHRSLQMSSASGMRKPTSTDDSMKNPLLGADSFLSSGGVWTRRYAIRELPSTLMDGLGTIVEKADVPGPPPKVPQGRNFLKGPPQMSWRGNAWDVTEQYMLSGRGGWVKLLYDGSTE